VNHITEPELTAIFLRLIALKFETGNPTTILNRMGPTWRAYGMQTLRQAVERGDTITIETLWGTPNEPRHWRFKAY
jgi:hypothetical protein